ncbi:hypothetical protein EXW50_28070 (plasmid) [Bacillus mycoides]|uniref:hypothetical protein n=1 Tax=Bacillus mycoides TaxID=1405 RepID=UPI001C00AFDA|nr:hypothetical protein [Bacillus mycoides]QWG75813.1 hypothetical protein EXW63_27650 [Bacillus mycoides]QWH26196.1 hypothetical protein EXW50_28070 [Bacillus mycoides]
MSFVSIAMTEDFISVMSDGRVNHEGSILREDYQKFAVLEGGTAFVTITGTRAQGERAIEVMKKSYNEEIPLAGLAIGLQTILSRDISHSVHPQIKLNMALGGISDGRLEVYTLSNEYESPKDVKMYSPKKGDMSFITFEADEVTKQNVNLTESFLGYLRQTGIRTLEEVNPKHFLQAQKQLNDFVASFDSSVNTNTFELVVEK